MLWRARVERQWGGLDHHLLLLLLLLLVVLLPVAVAACCSPVARCYFRY